MRKGTADHTTPFARFRFTQGGSNVGERVSDKGGVVNVQFPNAGTLAMARLNGFAVVNATGARYCGLASPVPGEDFIAPAELRLVAAGGYYTTPAASVTFYAMNASTGLITVLGSVLAAAAEFNVFQARYAAGLATGTWYVFARADYADGSGYDSPPAKITVSAAPTYAQTINLAANTAWNSATLGSGTLNGSAGARIRVNGNGFQITGSAAGPRLWNYVDFFNLGATSGQTTANGVDITITSGADTLTNCRHFGCATVRTTMTSSGVETVDSNLWASNSRNQLAQAPFPDGSPGSYSAAQFLGAGAGAKTFTRNNSSSGWIELTSANWTVGGSDANRNIAIGARAGIYPGPATGSSFTGTVSYNFLLHLYWGGWSQGSCYEIWGRTSLVTEHNIIGGSSWPVRGMDSEFRYNYVFGDQITEGLIWPSTGAGTAHHNVLRCPTPQGGRGLIFDTYAGTPAFRNNTLDAVDQGGESTIFMTGSASTLLLNSNLLKGSRAPAVSVGAGTLTANYNGFENAAGAHYSDGRSPANDVTAVSGVTGFTDWIPTVFDLEAIWKRTLSVSTSLATVRTAYTPTNAAFDVGDTAVYGASNPIGAIPRASVTNTSDLFGKLIQPLSLGVHGKDVDINGAGTSPSVATLGTTQATRSAIVSFVLGHFGNLSASVVDSKANTLVKRGTDQGYAGGLFIGFGLRMYATGNCVGGAGHTISMTKTAGNSGEEFSQAGIEVISGQYIHAFNQGSAAAPGQGIGYVSPTITTTGPAILLAAWGGDGDENKTDQTVNVSSPWQIIESAFTGLTQLIQFAVAWRAVTAAGTYSATWTPVQNQGGAMFMVAVQ